MDLEDVQYLSGFVWSKVRAVSKLSDVKTLLADVRREIWYVLHERMEFKRLTIHENEGENRQEEHEYKKQSRGGGNQQQQRSFWMCRTAQAVYAITLFAILTRKWWILHGISILLLNTILGVAIKWIVYIVDDPELWYSYRYIRGWIQLFLKEGEDLLNDGAAWKFAMASSVVSNAPTGISYVKYIYRYKQSALRQVFVKEMGTVRYGTKTKQRLQKQINQAIATGTAMQEKMRVSAQTAIMNKRGSGGGGTRNPSS